MVTRRPTVYIPTFNRVDLLLRTLVSLHSQTTPSDIVVVDNGSSDNTALAVKAEFPDVDLVALPENMGFGPAINFGVRQHPSPLLLLLNNDVECHPQFVEAMVDALGARTDAVAGVLLQWHDPERIDSAGVDIDSTLMPFDHLHGRRAEEALGADPPLGPTGGAALFRADSFRDAGGFDDRIFAYLEDVDLALRMRSRGGSCRLAATARVVHHHSATLGAGSARKNELMGFSRAYLLRRYGVMRRPQRALRALATEAVICGAQLAFDHTVSGVVGRSRGWRAAKSLPRRVIPSDIPMADVSALEALRARARQARVRRSGS